MFRLCVGDLKPTNVSLHVVNPVGEDINVQCNVQKRFGIWEASSVLLSRRDYHYEYVIDLVPKSPWKIYNRVKQTFASPTSYEERVIRTLPKYVNICRDVFDPRPSTIELTPLSVCPGIINSHLQSLLDSVKDINVLTERLYELEHLSRAFDDELLSDSNTNDKLRAWIEKSLKSNYLQPHKVVLLGVIYGRMARKLNMHAKNSIDITQHAVKQTLGSLENAETKELTKWSMEGLRVTALHFLEAAKKNNWVYAAASFPHLFDIKSIMDLSKTMKENTPKIHNLMKVLLPKVQSGYSNEEFSSIVQALLPMVKDPRDREQLEQLITNNEPASSELLPSSAVSCHVTTDADTPSSYSKVSIIGYVLYV